MPNTLILLICLLPGTTLARSLASIPQDIRVDHAKELMGRSYKRSVVSKVEDKQGLNHHIFLTVEKRLPKAKKQLAHAITDVIITEATKHALDPYFILAVIAGESSFNPQAIGPVGEIGLMQIRTSTGKWMAEIINYPWNGEETLRDPLANIRLGTAYLAWLREKFRGHGQLYLAAYNMGPRSVKNALKRDVWPKDYPIHVMKRYIAFYHEANAHL